MATTLRTVLFVLLFAFIMAMQYNLDADKTATRTIKNSIEFAVHDAGLAIDKESFSEGSIVFDQNIATDNFKKSLEKNLHATSSGGFVYKPDKDTFFQNDLYVVALDYIDDSNHTFPYEYKNEQYGVTERLNGPSIIAIMTTESPRWFRGNATYIRQAAVYEYKK